MWGCGGVVVSMLEFRSGGQWFEAQSLPLCCFLEGNKKLAQLYKMGTSEILLGVTLQWNSIPSRGEWQYSQLLHQPGEVLACVRLYLYLTSLNCRICSGIVPRKLGYGRRHIRYQQYQMENFTSFLN